MDRKAIKARARETMREYWGDLFAVLLLSSAASAVVGFFTLGTGGLIVAGPLEIGVLYIYYQAMQRKEFEYLDLLRYFKKRFGDIILAMLLVNVVSGLVAGMGIASLFSSMFSMGGMLLYGQSGLAAFGMVIKLIVFIASIVLVVMIVFGLAMVPVILLREEGIKAKDAVVKSWNMMKGYKGQLFVFYLSFIGWYLLVSVTFGIALIWVRPYYRVAKLGFLNGIYEQSDLKGTSDVVFDPELRGKVGGIINKVADKVDSTGSKSAPEQEMNQRVGAELAPMTAPEPEKPAVNVCKYCGKKLAPGAKFCGKCGKPQ